MEKSANAAASKVPGSVVQVGVITKYTFLDYFRSRRFFILLAIGLIISALLTFVVAHYRPVSLLASDLSFYSFWWGDAAPFVVILSGIFFGGDAIAGEFQNKTGYFTVPNPVRRSSVYVGKWIAAFIASSIILLIFTAITVANGAYYFGTSIPYQFVESIVFAWIYLIAVLGFTFFFSSLFKSGSYSILVTAILFLFAFTLIRTLVADIAGIEPWFIVTYGGEIIADVLMATYPAHVTVTKESFGPRGGTFTVTTFNPTITEGIWIMVVYFVVTAVLGLILFERKEFN